MQRDKKMRETYNASVKGKIERNQRGKRREREKKKKSNNNKQVNRKQEDWYSPTKMRNGNKKM
jgi:hypothetical protein